MAEVLSYDAFVQAFAQKSREEFLEKVTVPHLYFLNLRDASQTAGFKTLDIKSGVRRLDFSRDGILPLEKDTSGNSFGMMITLGRAKNNDLVIPDKEISKFHVYFRQLGKQWTITDANSRNGTMVDGVRIPPDRTLNLRSGATIVFCEVLRAVFLEPEDLYTMLQELNPG